MAQKLDMNAVNSNENTQKSFPNEQPKRKNWTDVSGFCKTVFVNEFGVKGGGNRYSYSACISSTDKDGNKCWSYVDLKFKNGIPTPKQKGKYSLDIKDGFWSFWTDKEGRDHLQVIVMDCDWYAHEN